VYFTSKSEDEELEEEVACQISPVFNSERLCLPWAWRPTS